MKEIKKILVNALAKTALLLIPTYCIADCNPSSYRTKPDSRYVINSNNTVDDTVTNLTWMRCNLGQSGQNCDIGTASLFSWQQALNLAESTDFATNTNWRLPNRRELNSLIDTSCLSPTINETIFIDTLDDYWTSSLNVDKPSSAWIINFDDGIDSRTDKLNAHYIRLVRDTDLTR